MSNLVFLLLAVVVSGIGLFALWLRTRDSSTSTSSIDEFSGKMRALAPEDRHVGAERDDRGA